MNDNKFPFDPDNDEEVATWVAQHSTADLPGEQVEMTVKRKSKDLQVLSLRLTSDDMDKLKALAESNGVGYTTMARIIIHNTLTQDQGKAQVAENVGMTKVQWDDLLKGDLVVYTEDRLIPRGSRLYHKA